MPVGFDGARRQPLVFVLMKKQSLNEPTTIAAYVEAITRALEARGVDPGEVLREIDVSRIRNNDPLVRISDSTVNAIYARAVALTGDEYFGLSVAERIVPGMLHAAGLCAARRRDPRGFLPPLRALLRAGLAERPPARLRRRRYIPARGRSVRSLAVRSGSGGPTCVSISISRRCANRCSAPTACARTWYTA